MSQMGKPRFEVVARHSNEGLFLIIALAYCATLGLFGWQTWGFVSFLFPDDQLLMKLLTLFSFDVMALIWGCAHRFYRFAHPSAKTAVAWGWAITNVLSLAATVVYMVIQSMFRFHLTIGSDVVNFGYGVTIVALVFNIALLAAFLYAEIGIRFPNHDEFVVVEQLSTQPTLPPSGRTVPSLPPQRPTTRRLMAPSQQRRVQPMWNAEDEDDEDEDEDEDDEDESQINVASAPQRASAQGLQRTTSAHTTQLPQQRTMTPPMQARTPQKMSQQPVQHLEELVTAAFQPALPIPIRQYQVNSTRQGSNTTAMHGQQPGMGTLPSVNMPMEQAVPSVQHIPTSQPLPSSQPVVESTPTHPPMSEQVHFPIDTNN